MPTLLKGSKALDGWIMALAVLTLRRKSGETTWTLPSIHLQKAATHLLETETVNPKHSY